MGCATKLLDLRKRLKPGTPSQVVVENERRRLEEIFVGERRHHRDRIAERLFCSCRGDDDDFVVPDDLLLVAFRRLGRFLIFGDPLY